MIEQIKSSLLKIRQDKPLILCLSNYVTMDFVANNLLALGAAPLMSEANEEIEELVNISSALYLNMGTLNDAYMSRALLASSIAQSLNKPIILDPVGTGASVLRTTNAVRLLNAAHVIRGNASEIISLSNAKGATKGVESVHGVDEAINTAKNLAHELNKVIVISGPTDYITDGQQEQSFTFGSALMPVVTGMGCALTAVMSAFVSTNPNHYEAATHAALFFSLCGHYAHEVTTSPGSFRQQFIDNLFNPNWNYFSSAYNS